MRKAASEPRVSQLVNQTGREASRFHRRMSELVARKKAELTYSSHAGSRHGEVSSLMAGSSK